MTDGTMGPDDELTEVRCGKSVRWKAAPLPDTHSHTDTKGRKGTQGKIGR